MIKVIYRAESIVSLMIAVLILSILFLAFSKWNALQNNQNAKLFHYQQAMQIIDNQINLKMAGLDCEKSIEQNGITFTVFCQNDNISIKTPIGEFSLQK